MAGAREVSGNSERFGQQRRKRRLHTGYEFHDVGQGPNRQLIGGDKSDVSVRTPVRRCAGNFANNGQVGARKRPPT